MTTTSLLEKPYSHFEPEQTAFPYAVGAVCAIVVAFDECDVSWIALDYYAFGMVGFDGGYS